ncbi:hypothetical protein K438DRAFT_1819644 [Mycena galopus ATCC 62051]|nr:hypothetical protein K438DRAFT_1819644 [Mycena galopus ATCC 62051]
MLATRQLPYSPPAVPEMRSVSTEGVSTRKGAGMQSLVISPNLDALLEHDERVRRMQQQGGTESPTGFVSQGLPPPPRRRTSSRGPGSPQLLSPAGPRSPVMSYAAQETRSNTPQSTDSNPYINPAPQWVEVNPKPESTAYSPPPRSSSMGIEFRGQTKSDSVSGQNGIGQGRDNRQSHDTDPASSCTPSPPKGLTKFPSERILRRKDRDNENQDIPADKPKRKLVKQPQAREMTETRRVVRRQRSARSISVSSAISTDRESFIDLFSPSNQDFPPELAESPFAAASPTPSNYPRLPKPPVPTTPKPDFALARRSVQVPLVVAPPRTGPPAVPVRAVHPDLMPPTTNFLNPTERAQLIKKSRKLAQVFGQTPSAGSLGPDAGASSFLDVAPGSNSKSRGHRPAASMNMVGQLPTQRPPPPWPVPDKTIYMTAEGRRHSTPSTPISDEAQTINMREGSDEGPIDSPRSFMDFSNEDPGPGPDDSISNLHDDAASLLEATRSTTRPRIPASPSSPSLFETLSPEEQAEEERRKKRDKLAKLHRFLGSRVPTSLVLGPDYLESAAPLPPAVVTLDGLLASPTAADERASRAWRRRSSSAAVLGSWSDGVDRLKEDLGEKEKASLVKRAQKMEKVFGVAPPQKLYSGASSASSSSAGGTMRSFPEPGTAPNTPPATFGKNQNQTPYKAHKHSQDASRYSQQGQRRSHRRPGTADSESGQGLLPNAEPSAGSFVYTHYQHSLNSLHDILDRNDKESLAELHQYLNDTDADAGIIQPHSPLEFAPTRAAALTKVERRRSLPARTSMASLASLTSISTTTGDIGTASSPDAFSSSFSSEFNPGFQQRRRRAAKLTQFFGVDYRDLIEDVLESIESGLDAERSRGTLNPQEAEDLLQKLRTLKTRR